MRCVALGVLLSACVGACGIPADNHDAGASDGGVSDQATAPPDACCTADGPPMADARPPDRGAISDHAHGRHDLRIHDSIAAADSRRRDLSENDLTAECDADGSSVACDSCPSSCPSAALPAFFGAQGAGAISVGGRGGRVILVTSLNDSGDGSLRRAVEASGPRIVLFRISGTIVLRSQLRVRNGALTIAGQTAPGGGIQLRPAAGMCDNLLRADADDVVIRYLRIRVGLADCALGRGGDAMSINGGVHRVIVDHVSMSWARDETFSVWANDTKGTSNITLQWSLLAEALDGHSVHFLTGGGNRDQSQSVGAIDLHHNLLLNASHRQPLIKTPIVRIVNNIVYNWGFYATQTVRGVTSDIISNLYQAGPLTPQRHEIQVAPTDIDEDAPGGAPSVYVTGNIGPHNANANADNWIMVREVDRENGVELGPLATRYRRTEPQPALAVPIDPDPADQLEPLMLSQVGASHRLDCDGRWVPNRDAVDRRLLGEYRAGTGEIPRSEADVGGYPDIEIGAPCQDSDGDGMPDRWEREQDLNLAANDGAEDRDGDGYTNLEEFLNGTRP